MARAPTASKAVLALTMGDPAGIGPEISIAAWRARTIQSVPPFALYADIQLMARYAGNDSVARVASAADAADVFQSALPVVDVPLAAHAEAGRPAAENAPATIAAIDLAVADTFAGRASALVTNPIAKAVLYAAGFTAPGHTEYLGTLSKKFRPDEQATPVMMLCARPLRVVPVTIHVPLRDVPRLLTQDKIVTAARITAEALRRDFGVAQPRLAVTGLNPHAGEGGAIGKEDQEIIAPAIAALRGEGIDATGPHSADTLFHERARKTYDAVIAMYHDQALIPIKTLAFDEGVNVTLGLPFVRTSPDHGTAFDIAGRGAANAESLIAALRLAADMSVRRLQARSAADAR